MLKSLEFDLAPNVNNVLPMNHLANITTRQTKTRMRDLMFTCFVGLAALMTMTSIGAAAAVIH